MSEVFIVYAHLKDGPSHAMKAFASRERANRYIQMVTRHGYDDEARVETSSAAEILDIAGFSIVPLQVEE